jgi:hypothetical protein
MNKKGFTTIALLVAVSLVFSACNGGQTQDEKPDALTGNALTSAYIKWQGRTEYADGGVRFYYTAAGFEVRFVGTQLKAELYSSKGYGVDEATGFGVSVDGAEFAQTAELSLTEERAWYVLAEGLENKEHTARVLKRSEPQDSANAVFGVTTDGYFRKTSTAAKLKLLFIGGSGISGHGSVGEPYTARTAANSSSLHAFGYLTAQTLNADFQFVANSGWGVRYGFNPTNNAGTVNLYTALTAVGIDTDENVINREYALSDFAADAVVVNAGGNDFSDYINGLSGTAKDNATLAFRAAVKEMITTLHAAYPNAYIVWTYTSGSVNGAQAAGAIGELPAEVRQYVLPTVIAQVGDFGEPQGANGHAGVLTHKRIAAAVVAALQGKM